MHDVLVLVQIVTLDDLGSREHIFDAKWPRCFETMLLCQLKGLYSDRPNPAFPVDDADVYGDMNVTYDGDKSWEWWRAGPAGQYVSRCAVLIAFDICPILQARHVAW